MEGGEKTLRDPAQGEGHFLVAVTGERSCRGDLVFGERYTCTAGRSGI